MVLDFDTLPPSLNGKNGLMRSHWTKIAKMQKEWYWRVREQMGDLPNETFDKCVVIYTMRRVKLMDWDNACASFKLLGDALVKNGILTDDSPAVIREFRPVQIKVAHRDQQGCRVEILEYLPFAE